LKHFGSNVRGESRRDRWFRLDADYLINQAAILEYQQRRNAADAELCSGPRIVVDV
jgi:hypothetical protein